MHGVRKGREASEFVMVLGVLGSRENRMLWNRVRAWWRSAEEGKEGIGL